MHRILLSLIALFGFLSVLTGCGDSSPNAEPGSTDASLIGLVPSEGALTPEFDSSVGTYALSVPRGSSALTLTATATQSTVRSIQLTQDDGVALTLKSGKASPNLVVPAVGKSSVVDIAVTSADASAIKHYVVTLQGAPPSLDASLSSLTATAGILSPAFSPGTFAYSLPIPNGTPSVTFTAVANNVSASIALDGAAAAKGPASLQVATPALGTTVTLTIVVTAEDGVVSAKYVVSVSQRPAPSIEATLSALVPSSGALIPAFAPNSRSYVLRVPVTTTSVTVTPTATSAAATLSVNASAIQSGQPSAAIPLLAGGTSTKIEVVVTAEDPTKTLTYSLSVVRQAATTGPTIFSIGDSTMADYDPAAYATQRGWGQMFSKFIVDSKLTLSNRGINGRSTKSYYTGTWDIIKGQLNAGDYVLIQFGHNDEKDSGIEGSSGIGTAAWGAYHDYLTRFVNETRALGAFPVLVTPVVRLSWSGTSLTSTACHDLTGNGIAIGNADYPAAMRDVAATLGCPLVDMTASTKALVEAYGATDAKALLYISSDNTHLQILGATEYARLVAEGLLSAGLFREQLNPAPGIISSSYSLDFGERYLGTTAERAVSIVGVALSPSSGALSVSAPAGYSVSLAAIGPFETTLQIPYTHAALSPTTVYVRFAPVVAQAYAGILGVGAQAIALLGTALELPALASEAQVSYALESATAGTTCTSTGAMLCAEETFSGLYVKDYLAMTALDPAPVPLPTQRISILNPASADSWPAETDFNPARYVEFALSPMAGKSLGIDTLSLYAGFSGGPTFGLRVQYATTGDFTNPREMVNAPDNAPNALSFFTHSPKILVGPSETLRIRIFPYSKALASSKYLALRAMTVHGVAY